MFDFQWFNYCQRALEPADAVLYQFRMGKLNKALVEAYRKGWRVTDDGVLLHPNGKKAKTYIDRWDRERSSTAISLPGVKGYQNVMVHRLAAYQWFGPIIFETGIQVRHLNNDSRDNARCNIAIGSQSENMMDIDPEERKKKAIHAASFLRSLSSSQAQSLINDRAAGMKYKDLMGKYSVAKGTVSYIVNGKTYPELDRSKLSFSSEKQESAP